MYMYLITGDRPSPNFHFSFDTNTSSLPPTTLLVLTLTDGKIVRTPDRRSKVLVVADGLTAFSVTARNLPHFVM